MAALIKEACQQGLFDRLCSFYALVNTVNQLRGPLEGSTLKELFDDLIEEFSCHWSTKEALLVGISSLQLSRVIRLALTSQYQLVCKRPFYKNPNADIRVVWFAAKQWVDEGGVILIFNGQHWSVVYRFTPHRIYLRDSWNAYYILKKKVFEQDKEENKLIYPSLLYFIKREEDML